MFSPILATMLAAASPAAAPAGTPDAAATRINATPARDGWFVCDAVSGNYAALVGRPDAGGASLITLLDRRTGSFDTQSYQVGPGDPGAGQIFWSLSQKGQEVGNVHGVNPGMVDGATLPPILQLTVGKQALECRWLSNMRFIGFDSRRSFVVTEGPDGLVYQSFDFRRRGALTRPDGAQVSNVPTLRIEGGSDEDGAFRFQNGGYDYVIARNGTAPGTVTVSQAGKPVQVERLVGYSWAPSPGRAHSAVTLGPDAVWNGEGLNACRAKTDAAAVDACLLDAMKQGGASPAAIAFTRTTIAGNGGGYVSGWRQAGPVGIAEVTFPFRANTNIASMLVPTSGPTIMVDDYQPTTADKARPDWLAARKRHPKAFPIAPGEVSAPKTPAGEQITIRARTPTADCHACKPTGAITVVYRFDRTGKLLSQAVERVD